MPNTSWESLANSGTYSQINTGSAYSNSTSLTDVSPGGNVAGQAFVLPASYLYTGLQLRVGARGVYSTTGTPNITLGVYYGGVAGTALATATFAASANASNAVWTLGADIRCDATGTSATLRTLGSISGVAGSGPTMLPQTAGGGGAVTIASGASNILTIGAQWGTPSSSNTLQVLEFLVEQLN